MSERLTQRTELGTAVFNNEDIGDIAKNSATLRTKSSPLKTALKSARTAMRERFTWKGANCTMPRKRSRLIEKCQEAEKINKEKCNLEYTLLGVMHSVDKWLDGAELEQDEVKRAITMREKTLQIVEKLANENEKLTINMNAYGLTAKRLVEDNERLRGILLQFTDIVHKWGNKHGYDTSEISLVSILNEESEIKKQIREETIKEFQSRLNEQRGYDDDWNYNSWWGETINQIAKEMVEGEKGETANEN